MFEDPESYVPGRDAKVPLRRGLPFVIARAGIGLLRLTLSRHPVDAVTWVWSFWARRRPLSLAMPWLTFDAIRAIRRTLPAGGRVFEYGGGHSTLFWATREATVTTVEHDPAWYRALGDAIARGRNRGVTLSLAVDRESYIGQIDRFPGSHFDLVLVDGRFRRACVVAAVPHVKPGGLLVVDNTDWHWYRERAIEGIPVSWIRTVYPGYAPMLGHRSETTIWQRPPDDEPVPPVDQVEP